MNTHDCLVAYARRCRLATSAGPRVATGGARDNLSQRSRRDVDRAADGEHDDAAGPRRPRWVKSRARQDI
jgi:hypothetical protein